MPQLSVTQQSDGRSRGGSHVCESLSGRTLAGKTADGRLSGVRFQEREGMVRESAGGVLLPLVAVDRRTVYTVGHCLVLMLVQPDLLSSFEEQQYHT